MRKILIIDDDLGFRETVKETIEDLGYPTATAEGVAQALRLLNTTDYGLILIDFQMPGLNGLEGIKLIRDSLGDLEVPIAMVTSYPDAKTTIEALKFGAADHVIKPVTRDRLKTLIEKLYVSDIPKAPLLENAAKADPRLNNFELLGKSEAIREVLKLIGKVADTPSSVLITGETGTGKEVVAQLIHRYSDRASAPFTAVNCAAIPDALLESELFGHSRGAFTGATSDRKGAFEQAANGTLFLDEIGITARFIAATHQHLIAMVHEGLFRADLFFRLNVIEISLPPLREREGDVEFLAKHFLQEFSANSTSRELSAAALDKLNKHDWPGNIRELKNVIERAALFSKGRVIDASDLVLSPSHVAHALNTEDVSDLPGAIRNLEKRYIKQALLDANDNRSEAARKLGIGRQLLYAKIKEFGLEKDAE